MISSSRVVPVEKETWRAETPWPGVSGQRPSFRWSDIWNAPLHDFPIRDEILYQYLPLFADMRVLEVGPGSGFTAFRLARQVRHLTLLDAAAANIDQLRGVLKQLPNVDFICADACAPGLAESVGTQFDAVFALEVFEYLPAPEQCLRNLSGLLRRGGHLLIQFPNYPPPKNPGVTFFPKRADLDRMFRAAGFQKWAVYALNLRPYADGLYREFHERPIQLLRRLRHGRGNGCPQTYDASWAFQHQKILEPCKFLVHGAWTVLSAALRMGGDCFERSPLGDEILNRNLLVLASGQA